MIFVEILAGRIYNIFILCIGVFLVLEVMDFTRLVLLAELAITDEFFGIEMRRG